MGFLNLKSLLHAPIREEQARVKQCLFDYLLKAKHSIRELFLNVLRNCISLIWICMEFVEKFDNVKATSIDVKVDIVLFKIRGHGFPYSNLWMTFFDFTPGCIADSFAVSCR